jgi:protein TonB
MMASENVASRGVVGAGILAAHLGLVVLLISSGFIKPPTLVQSVSVTFLQQADKELERPNFDRPILTPLHQVLVPPPEVVVPVEPTSATIAATAVESPPSPPPSAPSDSGTSTAVAQMSDVAYLVQPAPRYPPESRRIHEQGLVVLRVLIDEGGHVKTVEIYRSSGHPRLDEAAREAVARAVFKPYVDGGIARAAAAIVPIEFSLRAASS